MRPMVIVAGREAEHNPDKDELTIQLLFPKLTGGKGDAGEIILINGDLPQIMLKAPEAVEIGTQRRGRVLRNELGRTKN